LIAQTKGLRIEIASSISDRKKEAKIFD